MSIIPAILLLTTLFQAGNKTVWDGAYTAEQAARGKVFFEQRCMRCHGENLQGGQSPPLTTDRFLDHWREGALENLFVKISTSMPPGGGDGISQSNYLDIVARILEANAFPAGTQELTADALKTIRIVGKEGSQPVPNNALIQAVGCLSPGPDSTWILTNVAEPVRNRVGDEITADELKGAGAGALGTQAFRLQNIELVDFNAPPHQGHKMLVKGVLFRSPSNNRINVTAIAMAAETCR